MISEHIWIELYLQGYSLEYSKDGQHWAPIYEEPYAGDGNYYRRALNEPHLIPIQSKQHLPHRYTH